jgi:hypothetical protein
MTQRNDRIPEGFQDLLQSTAVAHVATIGPEGETQNSPVWSDWDGEYVMFSQTKTRQKLRNLSREPKIALSIVDPEDRRPGDERVVVFMRPQHTARKDG